MRVRWSCRDRVGRSASGSRGRTVGGERRAHGRAPPQVRELAALHDHVGGIEEDQVEEAEQPPRPPGPAPADEQARAPIRGRAQMEGPYGVAEGAGAVCAAWVERAWRRDKTERGAQDQRL